LGAYASYTLLTPTPSHRLQLSLTKRIRQIRNCPGCGAPRWLVEYAITDPETGMVLQQGNAAILHEAHAGQAMHLEIGIMSVDKIALNAPREGYAAFLVENPMTGEAGLAISPESVFDLADSPIEDEDDGELPALPPPAEPQLRKDVWDDFLDGLFEEDDEEDGSSQ